MRLLRFSNTNIVQISAQNLRHTNQGYSISLLKTLCTCQKHFECPDAFGIGLPQGPSRSFQQLSVEWNESLFGFFFVCFLSSPLHPNDALSIQFLSLKKSNFVLDFANIQCFF